MKQHIAFVETKAFSKRIVGLISDDQFSEFQADLAQDPQKGAVIEGTGGLRKVRWRLPGRGKSGGLRIIYLYVKIRGQVHLVFVFAKNEAVDLSSDQKKNLRAVVAAIKEEYRT